MNIKKWALLIAGFCMVFGRPVFAIDYDDEIALEPYPLTKEIAHQLTQKDNSQTTDSTLVLKGINLSITNQITDRFSLAVNADPKLNLWSGEFAHFAQGHMGTIKLIISSITDKDGSNIYNEADNSVWNKEQIEINRLHDGSFGGTREMKFKQKSYELYPTKVVGKIQLSLPVNIKKYEIKLDSRETINAFLERDDIDTVGFSNGITVTHPESMPEFPVTIIGFNKENKILKVVSMGSAGVDHDNHWYYFKPDSGFNRALIFIPDEMIDIEIPFSLLVKDIR